MIKFYPNILVDETDVIKPCGKAFEGLNYIHDSSKEGKPREKGYPVTGIVTLTEDNNIVALISNIYSSLSKGHKSINDETKKHLDKIIPHIINGDTSTISFDRGYDGSLYAEYVAKNNQFYVIRAKEKRIYLTKHGKMNINGIANRYKGKHSFTYKTKDGKTIYAKASAIKVSHRDFDGIFYIFIKQFIMKKTQDVI